MTKGAGDGGAVVGDGPVASALRAATADDDRHLFLVSPADAAQLIDQASSAARRGAYAVVVIVDDQVSTLARALMLAAIAPLALEMAPDTRIAAIQAMANAPLADIVATALFLARAEAVTGQTISVGTAPATA